MKIKRSGKRATTEKAGKRRAREKGMASGKLVPASVAAEYLGLDVRQLRYLSKGGDKRAPKMKVRGRPGPRAQEALYSWDEVVLYAIERLGGPRYGSLLSVDPSSRAHKLAFCKWDPRERIETHMGRIPKPQMYGTVDGVKGDDDKAYARIPKIVSRLFSGKRIAGVTRVVVEAPEVWAGSKRSRRAALSGDLLKLAMVTGAIVGQAQGMGFTATMLTPAKWKGQVSKEVTAKRVKEDFGITSDSNDVTDAIGIGRYYWIKELHPRG